MSVMTPMTCGRCGAPIRAGAAFCSFCGVAFAATPGSPAAPAATGGATGSVDAELVDLLRRRLKIEAIKVYRTRHRTSLGAAKDAIEALEKSLGLG